MGYLLDIAKKVQIPQWESTSTYYELNELNEVSPIVVNNAPTAEHMAADQNVIPSLSETITYMANMNASWSTAAQNLIDWFMTAPRNKETFQLDEHRLVCNPEKFYDSIMRDIQAGPSDPRNKHGVLIDDLKKLKIVMDGYNTGRSIDKKSAASA